MNSLDMLSDALQPVPAQAVDADLARRLTQVESQLDALKAEAEERNRKMSLLVFSGTQDRLLTAFTLATSAAAMGIEVTMFFAFWGIGALRCNRISTGKNIFERMMGAMLPANAQEASPSQWSFGGVGKRLFRFLMRRHRMMQLEEMITLAQEMGVRFVCCDTTTQLMGIRQDELVDTVQPGGVASFLGAAYSGNVTLFI